MPYGRYRVDAQLGAAALQLLDERHRLAVERRVLGRRRRAEVRLQRDVAEILQRERSRARRSGRGSPAPAPASAAAAARR